MKQILLGYEIGTGKPVKISPSHIVCCGITQLSGKTTTLEALIKRSGLRAITFKTKIGEKSFTEGTETQPFFRDRSDYEFVKSLIEAYSKEKLFIEKGTLMRLSRETSGTGLVGLKRRVDEVIAEGRLRGINLEIYTRLQHYLENIIPQIQYSNLSRTLNVYDGINIVNLERFSDEAQSLIIEATVSEVLTTMHDTICVIPESWKFIPQKYNNPCKRAVESYIRQGASNNNFLWLDSQDMAGVDKLALKQVSTWILGYQAERNEVKHTLDQMSLPKKSKPKEDEIMRLKIGQFFLSTNEGVTKVYVCPAWMPPEEAILIAKGEKSVEDVKKSESLVPYGRPSDKTGSTPSDMKQVDTSEFKKEIVELRMDFFNKIQELQTFNTKVMQELYRIDNKIVDINVDELVSKVLQKMPMTSSNFNKEELILEIQKRMPISVGGTSYTVSPLEKLKKTFLEEAKDKVLTDIKELDDQQKKILKWIEQNAKGTTKNELFLNCFGKSATSGGTYTSLVKKATAMKQLELIRIDTNSRIFPNLKDRISGLIERYGATPQEIDSVYNHVLSEMI